MKVTFFEGGGDAVDGVTGPCRATAAVSVTETRRGQTLRILSGLTAGRTNQSTGSQTQNWKNTTLKGVEVSVKAAVNELRGLEVLLNELLM